MFDMSVMNSEVCASEQPSENLMENCMHAFMYSRSLSSGLSVGYLCGRMTGKCKHNSIASTGNYWACHIQMDVRNSKQNIILSGAQCRYHCGGCGYI